MASLGVYVTNNAADDVTVIDSVADTFVTTVAVGHSPRGICVLHNDKQVFVDNFGGGSCSVIDTATEALVGPPNPVTGLVGPFLPGPSIDNARVFVPNSSLSSVSVIAVATRTIIATITAGLSNPNCCQVSPDNSTIWVASASNQSMCSFQNTPPFNAAHAPIVVAAAGETLTDIAISPNGQTVWVTAPGISTNHVYIIDTSTFAVTSLAIPNHPTGIAFRPDGLFAYVTNNGSGQVTVIDATAHTTTTFNVQSGPQGIALLPNGSKGYCLNAGAQTVSVFNPATNIVTNTLATAPFMFASPQWIAIAPTPLFPPALTVPPLFIPRKGLAQYDRYDYEIDWRAIERWANSWAPTLFIPNKPEGIPNQEQLKENWTQIEVWAQGTARGVVVGAGLSFTPLFIPRKETMTPIDLTTNWNTIQNWGNLPP